MRAKSIIGDTFEEIRAALNESLANWFEPTLAFSSIPYQTDNHAFYKLFDKKGISTFGVARFGKEMEVPISIKEIFVRLLEIRLCVDVFSGWNSVGMLKTKSNANIILKIDTKPAVDITMKHGSIKYLPADFFKASI